MRFKVLGLAAMIGAMISAGPAMACYNGCGGGLFTSGATSYGCGYVASGCGVTFREQLPNLDAGPQYYYVNQGLTYTGPGNIAPVPTYQERSVSGWTAYSRPYYYGYNGGPYAHASHHYYDGARLQGHGDWICFVDARVIELAVHHDHHGNESTTAFGINLDES